MGNLPGCFRFTRRNSSQTPTSTSTITPVNTDTPETSDIWPARVPTEAADVSQSVYEPGADTFETEPLNQSREPGDSVSDVVEPVYEPGVSIRIDNNEASVTAVPESVQDCLQLVGTIRLDVLPQSISFIDPIEIIACDNQGIKYHNERHDVTLSIPPSAVPPGKTVRIQFGVTLYNRDSPFVIPEGSMVVSPIVWLCILDNVVGTFELDVELTLAHFLDPTVSDTCEFWQADHRVTEGMLYHFKPADGYTWFSKYCAFGVLTTNHFCFSCIIGEVSGDIVSAASFCLIEGVPKTIPRLSTWQIVYILCYFLKTCISVSYHRHCTCAARMLL